MAVGVNVAVGVDGTVLVGIVACVGLAVLVDLGVWVGFGVLLGMAVLVGLSVSVGADWVSWISMARSAARWVSVAFPEGVLLMIIPQAEQAQHKISRLPITPTTAARRGRFLTVSQIDDGIFSFSMPRSSTGQQPPAAKRLPTGSKPFYCVYSWL